MSKNVQYILPNDSNVKMTLYFHWEWRDINGIKKRKNICEILKFEWAGMEYNVKETVSEWDTPVGDNLMKNFVVKAKGWSNTFQFQLDTKSFKWVLVKVH